MKTTTAKGKPILQCSANPFVEVDFDGQRQRTQTKSRDLNPSWNKKLIFNIKDHHHLPNATVEVTIYNDKSSGAHHGGESGHHKNFLGRVRISGDSGAGSESEAAIQRYPLDKRGLFSHIRGDIALKIYAAVHGQFSQPEAQSHVNLDGNHVPFNLSCNPSWRMMCQIWCPTQSPNKFFKVVNYGYLICNLSQSPDFRF